MLMSKVLWHFPVHLTKFLAHIIQTTYKKRTDMKQLLSYSRFIVVAVLLAAEMHSLQADDILVSLDVIGLDADGRRWMDGFYPAFLVNSRADGKLWSVPFQRSTAVMYYNKAAFQDAGLNPDAFPKTWAELSQAAERLVTTVPVLPVLSVVALPEPR